MILLLSFVVCGWVALFLEYEENELIVIKRIWLGVLLKIKKSMV